MSSQPPYALLKAEIQHLKEVNAELLVALEHILSYHRFDISDEDVSRVVAAIAKAKAS